jgi:hypothetical protein
MPTLITGKASARVTGARASDLTPPRPVVDLRGPVAVSLRKTQWGNLSEDHRG